MMVLTKKNFTEFHENVSNLKTCFLVSFKTVGLRNVELGRQVPPDRRRLELRGSRIGSFVETGNGHCSKRVCKFGKKYETRAHYWSDAKGNIKGLKFFCQKCNQNQKSEIHNFCLEM